MGTANAMHSSLFLIRRGLLCATSLYGLPSGVQVVQEAKQSVRDFW